MIPLQLLCEVCFRRGEVAAFFGHDIETDHPFTPFPDVLECSNPGSQAMVESLRLSE